MRPKAVFTLSAVAGVLAFSAPDAHAQRRRRGGSSNESGATAVTPPPPSSSSSSSSSSGSPPPSTPPASTPARASGDGASSGASSARASRSSAAPNQVLVSGMINRPGVHQTRVNVELFAGVAPGAWGWPWGGFVPSAGLRLGFPLTRNGFLGNINNDVRLMIGAQVYLSILPPLLYVWPNASIALQWNFFLSEQWSVLLEAGLSADVFVYDLINCYDHPRLYCDRVYFHPTGALGLRRHLSGPSQPGFPALAFRFTYPAGVQVALEF